MTALHSVFQRAAFAVALLGTGIAGPRLLPTVAADEAIGLCIPARQSPGSTISPAITPRRPSLAVVAMRD